MSAGVRAGLIGALERISGRRFGNDPALAAAIMDAQSDPGRLRAMGDRAAVVARVKYTRGQSAAGYLRLFQELTGGPANEEPVPHRLAA